MRWTPIATLKDEALPNLMRKVIAHGLEHDPDPKGRASAKGKPVFGQDPARSETGEKI
jgi:hypothetical protein